MVAADNCAGLLGIGRNRTSLGVSTSRRTQPPFSGRACPPWTAHHIRGRSLHSHGPITRPEDHSPPPATLERPRPCAPGAACPAGVLQLAWPDTGRNDPRPDEKGPSWNTDSSA